LPTLVVYKTVSGNLITSDHSVYTLTSASLMELTQSFAWSLVARL